jgi:predicted TPR repeat methyltransferase
LPRFARNRYAPRNDGNITPSGTFSHKGKRIYNDRMTLNMKQSLDDLFQQALQLHQSGEFTQAEKLYQKIIRKDPKRAEVFHLLGILAGQQGRFELALSWVKAALKLQPSSASFHNSMANIQRNLGHTQEAIVHFEKALEIQPESAATNNNIGILYHKQKQLELAEKYYQRAIEIKPDYADAHFNLSTVLTLQEKFTEAIVQLEMALEHQPQHLQALAHLGQLLLQQGRAADATKYYQMRLEIDPHHPDTHHQLAVALTQQDKVEQAIVHYQETLKLAPNHTEALHNLGALYLVQRKPELALQRYLQLLELQPDLDTFYNLGVIYLYQDRHDDAIYYLQEALRLNPQYFNAHLNLGAVYLKKEDLSQAAYHYEQALALKPEDPEIIYILAAISQKAAPVTAPKEYIEHLFDQYAPYFEKHLQEYLHYQVPQLLFKAVTEIILGQTAEWIILDLGCGTGLCGVAFKRLAKQLIGIDLSDNMLTAAAQKQVYDELKKIDIEDALKTYQEVDLVLAGDVFGYVGELDVTFALAYSALREKGLFAFTVEKTYEKTFVLQPNARFAHNRQYVEELAVQHSFRIERAENAILRSQKQQPVEGYVFVLSK